MGKGLVSLGGRRARLHTCFQYRHSRRSWKSTDFQDSQKSPISVSGVPLVDALIVPKRLAEKAPLSAFAPILTVSSEHIEIFKYYICIQLYYACLRYIHIDIAGQNQCPRPFA